MHPLSILFILCAIFIAVITSGRIAYVQAKRWKFGCSDKIFFFSLACALAAGVVVWVLAYHLALSGGPVFALIGALGTLPLVALVWILIIGGNVAAQRMLEGLQKKLG